MVKYKKLSVKGLSLGIGIATAFFMLLLGIMAVFGWGVTMAGVIKSIYPGFEASISGIILGIIYGFIDGAICGAIIAWVYNKFI